jgi:hypothetical protein
MNVVHSVPDGASLWRRRLERQKPNGMAHRKKNEQHGSNSVEDSRLHRDLQASSWQCDNPGQLLVVAQCESWISFTGVIPKPGAVPPGEGSRVGAYPGRLPICTQDPLRLRSGQALAKLGMTQRGRNRTTSFLLRFPPFTRAEQPLQCILRKRVPAQNRQANRR